jgi:hypothetical protein
MDSEISILIFTAALISFVNTALSPNHYVSFIALSKSQKWSNFKIDLITLIYGLNFFPLEKNQKHIHALAGISILLCGISIQFLGL